MPLHAGALALFPMGWGIRVIVWITAQIAQWPDAMLRIAPMPPAAILLIAAGLVWLCIWRSTPRLAGIPVMALGAVLALLARPPDVLVSPDARLIAIRSGGTVFLITQRKGDRFTLEQWAPVWGQVPLTPAECTENTCRVGPVLFAAAPLAECTGSAIAVSPVEFTGCAGPVIDRLYVYRNGATAAWVNGTKVTLRTDRAVQGLRPWVAPYPQL
jgi:competence protein ComEC